MNNIFIEVPKTTNEVKVSVPCRNGDLLWQFKIIFTELKNEKTRMVTVYDNGCEDEERESIQSKIAKNENHRKVDFYYESEEDAIKLSVVFCKKIRTTQVSW